MDTKENLFKRYLNVIVILVGFVASIFAIVGIKPLKDWKWSMFKPLLETNNLIIVIWMFVIVYLAFSLRYFKNKTEDRLNKENLSILLNELYTKIIFKNIIVQILSLFKISNVPDNKSLYLLFSYLFDVHNKEISDLCSPDLLSSYDIQFNQTNTAIVNINTRLLNSNITIDNALTEELFKIMKDYHQFCFNIQIIINKIIKRLSTDKNIQLMEIQALNKLWLNAIIEHNSILSTIYFIKGQEFCPLNYLEVFYD